MKESLSTEKYCHSFSIQALCFEASFYQYFPILDFYLRDIDEGYWTLT